MFNCNVPKTAIKVVYEVLEKFKEYGLLGLWKISGKFLKIKLKKNISVGKKYNHRRLTDLPKTYKG